jgi:NAD(P)-dependent dehydrogenase (short-subunit alcohol dehydrogenase family)
MPASKTSEPHTGRVALVTGAAHGIGQAIAAGLAERGTRIVLGDIDDVSEASDLIGATCHPAAPVTPDVSDPSSIEGLPAGFWLAGAWRGRGGRDLHTVATGGARIPALAGFTRTWPVPSRSTRTCSAGRPTTSR